MAFYFGLGRVIYVSLLLVNAIAVLNEERFLARIGLSSQTAQPAYNPGFDTAYGGAEQGGPSLRDQMVNLIRAVRTLLRIPLIFVNVAVIVYELILG